MKQYIITVGALVLAACMSWPADAKGPKGPKGGGPKGNNGNHYGWYKGGGPANGYLPYSTYYRPYPGYYGNWSPYSYGYYGPNWNNYYGNGYYYGPFAPNVFWYDD
jgi:hypothetical protein